MRRHDQDLQAYLDGQLGPRASEQVEARLRSDPRARQTLERLQTQGRLLRAMAETQADEASLGVIWARVEEGLAEAPPLGVSERLAAFLRRNLRASVWAGSGIALAGAAAILIGLVHRGGVPLAPATHTSPSNLCDIQDVAFGGGAGTVLTVPDSHGTQATIIWVTAQNEATAPASQPAAPSSQPAPNQEKIKL